MTEMRKFVLRRGQGYHNITMQEVAAFETSPHADVRTAFSGCDGCFGQSKSDVPPGLTHNDCCLQLPGACDSTIYIREVDYPAYIAVFALGAMNDDTEQLA